MSMVSASVRRNGKWAMIYPISRVGHGKADKTDRFICSTFESANSLYRKRRFFRQGGPESFLCALALKNSAQWVCERPRIPRALCPVAFIAAVCPTYANSCCVSVVLALRAYIPMTSGISFPDEDNGKDSSSSNNCPQSWQPMTARQRRDRM